MNIIKANFFGNAIKLALTEEETVTIISLTEKEIWENTIDENFLGGFKNKIVKQITTYDKLDNEYDSVLQDRDEKPRQFPFDSFLDIELSEFINNIQIVICDELGILGGKNNKYLDLEEISELREGIEMKAEIDKESMINNQPGLFSTRSS